jgi:hypothetical protein
MFRTNVNEMNVQAIDLGDEMRQRIQLRLAPAPIVISPPIAREPLNGRQLHALRFIRDRLPFRPSCRANAPAQVGKLLLRNVDAEGTDGIARGRRRQL